MEHYILVAGVDYQFVGLDFRSRCENRKRRIIVANYAREDLKFQIFDFGKGEIATTEVTYAGGRKAETITRLVPYSGISKSNYVVYRSNGETHYRFRDGQDDVMSILHVYSAVQAIGAHFPGDLIELSFFSHGWMGGPILVNSFDDRMMPITIPSSPPGTRPVRNYLLLPPGARDPYDMDPRDERDFTAPTMDNASLLAFRDAFHSEGRVWIWGCAFPRVVHEILTKIEHNRVYHRTGLGDEVLFRFTNLTHEAVRFLESNLKLVLGVGFRFPNERNIEVKFKYLKYALCKAMQATYSYHIASAADVKTYAPLLGTYSDYESGVRLPLMRVHSGFVSHFNFYKTYLGFETDPERRNYGEYRPGFTCTVPSP
jgi:hypothetical protein